MKKYRFITACLLILLAFLLFNIFNRNGNSTIETFNMDAATKEEITDELVIALFIEDITNVVTNFYSEYYSGEIAVYDYEIAIVDIEKKEPGFISVKFGDSSGPSNPFRGAGTLFESRCPGGLFCKGYYLFAYKGPGGQH